jgi:hypothetical protein
MSEIRVDTISERTNANGVTIDGLTIKDGGITATTGAIVLNEASADLDFRIETNGNSKMFFVDGGNDAVIFNGNSSDYEASSQMVQIHNAGLHITSGYGIQGGVNADRAQIGLTSGSGGNVLFKVNNSEVARFTSGGLAIGGTGAANTLDDYEEGTWTIVNGAVNGITYQVSSSSGVTYTKIGRQVTVTGTLAYGGHTADNNATYIGNLPFTSASGTNFIGKCSINDNTLDGVGVLLAGGVTYLKLFKAGSGTFDYVTRSESANQSISFTITYHV